MLLTDTAITVAQHTTQTGDGKPVDVAFYLVNTRMHCKRDIKMGLLCTPGGAVVLYRSFRFKKSEQPQIVAFNRIVVNYNVHFLFYLVLTIVRQDTKICNERIILVKVAYGFSCFYGRERERKQYVLHWCLYN